MNPKAAVNIMVVDDEPLILRLHTRALTNLGYDSVVACEGATQALQKMSMAERAPDLIMTDLNMPEMDGVEFLRHLVEHNYAGSVILVSGEDERVLQAAEKLVQAHRMTSLGRLRKPVTVNQLAAILEKWKPAESRISAAATKTYGVDELRSAILHQAFVNYYQPKISLSSGRVVGVEALVRLVHPQDGIVFPDQFIGLAEANGLIGEITRQVVTSALSHIKALQQASGLALQVAINVSMDDLGSLDFADYIAKEAAAAGVPAGQITLEVTESRLMKDLRAPLDVLTRLRLKRFRISIDDFGTGHSSLSQLRDMPFDELKIDRGFVHRACADETVRAIFDSSVMLAKLLGMDIVAEGVEDQADWDYVSGSPCDVIQGYVVAKPMPFQEVYPWIVTWEKQHARVAASG